MFTYLKISLFTILLFIFVGCGGGSNSNQTTPPISDNNTDSNITTSQPDILTNDSNISTNDLYNTKFSTYNSDRKIDLSVSPSVVRLSNNGNENIKVNLGDENKSLYVLFTNHSESIGYKPTLSHDAKIRTLIRYNKKYITKTTQVNNSSHPKYITAFRKNTKIYLNNNLNNDSNKQSRVIPIPMKKDIENTGRKFYLDKDASDSTYAYAKKIISNIRTKYGNKTLNIWVSKDSFGDTCTKKYCVTQDMVDRLANSFLKDGKNNDIYDWVTNVYGEEWGNDANAKFDNLITKSDQITILLTDINKDNSPNGGTIGYFYPKDNYKSNKSLKGSNERIMFYIDSVMFANDTKEDFWFQEIVATLAHEFQHMIHFYQKEINDNGITDTWINEMLSEATEDLVATKLEHRGPRNVTYTDGSAGDNHNYSGRYIQFNTHNTISLTKNSGDDGGFTGEDYPKVNAFGTFLTRNYGSAKLLHDIMHNNKFDKQAIVDAVNKSINGDNPKTFKDLLVEWGIAVMLSDHDSLQDLPTYNTGDFIIDKLEYKLGSINFFNYGSGPNIETTLGTVQPQGNYYYKIGDNLSGNIDINITLRPDMEATLIVK